MLPQLMIDNSPAGNIPRTPSVQPQIGDAYGDLGRGVAVLGAGLASVASRLIDERGADARAEEALARRAADDLHAEYATLFNGLAHGTVGPDGASVPGWDALTYEALDTEDGGAAKRLSKAQQAFLQSEKYTALSPRAKVLFDSRAQSTYAVMAEEAVKLDARNRLEGRKLKDEANLSASLAAADAVPLDDDDAWSRAAAKSANDAAVMRMGTEILNPEDLYAGGDPDPARLRFRGGEPMRALYSAEAAKTRESLTSARAARMINAARAETDLDRQESFLASAERFAQERVADEKTRAAVTTDAERIRAHALEKEKLTAWDALATGKPYAYEGSARREAAYREVMPKLEENRRKLARRAASEEAATFAAGEKFISAMIRAGFAIDPKTGKTVALDGRQQADANLQALRDGMISPEEYTATIEHLSKGQEASKKEKSKKITQELATALGTEIKTLWTAAGTILGEKEDAGRKIGSYTVEKPSPRMVPETFPPVMGPYGIPRPPQKTGRMIQETSTARRKLDLFSSDIARLADLLMASEEADGLMVDLDGNPATGATRMDYRAYKAKLIDDLKKRQMAFDIDAQLDGVHDALAKSAAMRKAIEGDAIRNSPAWRLRPPAQDQETSETDGTQED